MSLVKSTIILLNVCGKILLFRFFSLYLLNQIFLCFATLVGFGSTGFAFSSFEFVWNPCLVVVFSFQPWAGFFLVLTLRETEDPWNGLCSFQYCLKSFYFTQIFHTLHIYNTFFFFLLKWTGESERVKETDRERDRHTETVTVGQTDRDGKKEKLQKIYSIGFN
jgi:hypothetical protein